MDDKTVISQMIDVA